MLPKFIIVGATRSGTTSLYYYLKQHPEIEFPSLKEPRYFSSLNLELPQRGPGDETVDQKLVLDFEEYERLFDLLKNCKMVGEASSEYLTDADFTAGKIREVIGDIPIIIMLRNPVQRAYSAYNNLIRDGRETETFGRALELEESRRSDNWDVMWAYKYVGLYCEQVRIYMEKYSRVKVLIFEEFILDPGKHLGELFEFLGVRKDVEVDTGTAYSYSGVPKNRLVAAISGRQRRVFYYLRATALKLIPRRYLEMVSAYLFAKDEMPGDTERYLYDYYEKDVAALERLLKRDLKAWKRPGNEVT